MQRTTARWAVVAAMLLSSSASAHYLWVVIDSQDGDAGRAHIYFEGGPGPGDGHYLDPFVKDGVTWIRTLDKPNPQKLAMEERTEKDKRWLTAALPADGPRSIDSYGKFGVYRYGKTDVLLHYYARQLQVTDHDHLHDLGRAEQLALDIVPHDLAEGLELTVLWQGKPAVAAPIYVRGPKGFKTTLKTDAKGRALLKTPADAKGRCLLRTMVEQDMAGEDNGQSYSKIRHQATQILTLPIGG